MIGVMLGLIACGGQSATQTTVPTATLEVANFNISELNELRGVVSEVLSHAKTRADENQKRLISQAEIVLDAIKSDSALRDIVGEKTDGQRLVLDLLQGIFGVGAEYFYKIPSSVAGAIAKGAEELGNRIAEWQVLGQLSFARINLPDIGVMEVVYHKRLGEVWASFDISNPGGLLCVYVPVEPVLVSPSGGGNILLSEGVRPVVENSRVAYRFTAESPVVREGVLPTLFIGDKWVYRETAQGLEATPTYEVTGEDVTDGKNCYVMRLSVEYSKRESPWAFPSPPNPLNMTVTVTEKFDRETMQMIMDEQPLLDGTGVLVHTQSYKFPNGLPYPLEVGKECKFVVTGTTTQTKMGQSKTDKGTGTVVRKVEGIEEVTVPAGTFRCFKITTYYYVGDNRINSGTSWYSDKVKFDVKRTVPGNDALGHEIVLVSYSIH